MVVVGAAVDVAEVAVASPDEPPHAAAMIAAAAERAKTRRCITAGYAGRSRRRA